MSELATSWRRDTRGTDEGEGLDRLTASDALRAACADIRPWDTEAALQALIDAADIAQAPGGRVFLVAELGPNLLEFLCTVGADAAEAEAEPLEEDDPAGDGSPDAEVDEADEDGEGAPWHQDAPGAGPFDAFRFDQEDPDENGRQGHGVVHRYGQARFNWRHDRLGTMGGKAVRYTDLGR